MKRRNILKFVSLLGIGSFVMLAAASCTKTTTTTPNPNTPSDGGGMKDIMSGGDTNPGGNQGAMDAAAKELSDAKAALKTLLSNKSDKVDLYSDYAKIQNTLTVAYTSAEAILQNQSATLEQIKNATSTLQTAINTADVNKRKFDQEHSALLMPYKNLKAAITKKQTTIMGLNDSKYSAILNHINSASSKGEELVKQTLDPVSGNVPAADAITNEINEIEKVISDNALLERWKNNADQFANYQSYTLNKAKLENVEDARKMAQPGNYSFVGYSVDVTGAVTGDQQNSIPNWEYAQRTIFRNDSTPITNAAATDGETMAQHLSNVSWIYSLSGTGAKYTLEFTYYGPSTGYLYFPYKLVKTNDNVGLQYKLNNNDILTPITFGNDPTNDGKTPTVSDINVAKVTLSNLKFGENKIEFSVPADKVNPMIGNMYLTSSSNNLNKIYDNIFGNSVTTEENKTKVSVNTLSAYSLAADWSTVINEYSGALTLDDNSVSDQKYYLIGYVGGTSKRNGGNTIGDNNQDLPLANGTSNRNYVFYVNAPKEGDYYISGIYISGTRTTNNRWLQFSTGEANNVLKIETPGNGTDSADGNWNTALKIFDTASGNAKTEPMMKKTLKLKAGLNKIVVTGVENKDSGNAPNFGHLSFTLMNPQMQ